MVNAEQRAAGDWCPAVYEMRYEMRSRDGGSTTVFTFPCHHLAGHAGHHDFSITWDEPARTPTEDRV